MRATDWRTAGSGGPHLGAMPAARCSFGGRDLAVRSDRRLRVQSDQRTADIRGDSRSLAFPPDRARHSCIERERPCDRAGLPPGQISRCVADDMSKVAGNGNWDHIEGEGIEPLECASARVLQFLRLALAQARGRIVIVADAGPIGWIVAAGLGLPETSGRRVTTHEGQFAVVIASIGGHRVQIEPRILNAAELPATLALRKERNWS